MTPLRWTLRILLPVLALAVSPTACSRTEAPETARLLASRPWTSRP